MATTGRQTFSGLNTHKTDEETLDLDIQSGDTAKIVVECEWTDAVSTARSYASHPTYPWLKIRKATIERQPGLRAKVTMSFEGMQSSASYGTLEDTRTYSLEGTLSTEPIETHEDFDDFGGSADDPNTTNGANFAQDGSGEFLGFSGGTRSSNENRCKRGVKSYQAPALVYSQNINIPHGSVSGGLISVARLGKIDHPPPSSVLPDVGTRTWLLVSVSLEQIGRGARVSRSWRCSGKRGWDTDIYT